MRWSDEIGNHIAVYDISRRNTPAAVSTSDTLTECERKSEIDLDEEKEGRKKNKMNWKMDKPGER